MSKLTKEDILGMEAGRELDCLVALKVMNYIPASHNWWLPKGGKFNCSIEEASEWLSEKECGIEWSGKKYQGIPIYMFNPSSNIETAWKVVKRLNLKYTFSVSKGYSDEGWSCLFFWSDGSGDNSEYHIAYGQTAPLAICRAALLAVLEEKL